MEQQKTQHRTKHETPNPKQNQTLNQPTPTMKLLNPLNTMNFFKTLYRFSGFLRPEKESAQPQSKTINSMEQQTQHRTNRKTQNQTLKPRFRLFSPLTNAATVLVHKAVGAFHSLVVSAPVGLAIAGLLLAPVASRIQAHDKTCWDTYTIPKVKEPDCDCYTFEWPPSTSDILDIILGDDNVDIFDILDLVTPGCDPSLNNAIVWHDPILRCSGKQHPNHHKESYWGWCNMNNSVPVWKTFCSVKLRTWALYACLTAMLGASVTCRNFRKPKTTPHERLLCLTAIGTAIGTCSPCVIFSCAKTTKKWRDMNAWSSGGGDCEDSDSSDYVAIESNQPNF